MIYNYNINKEPVTSHKFSTATLQSRAYWLVMKEREWNGIGKAEVWYGIELLPLVCLKIVYNS